MSNLFRRVARLAFVLALLVVGLGVASLGSEWHAGTSPIQGANGQPLPGSIATLEQVSLNGTQQWITIRGKNVHNPVLLFLMGGTGCWRVSRPVIPRSPGGAFCGGELGSAWEGQVL